MTSVPTQNIYNDPSFFNAYSTLPRSEHGLAGAPEWPVLRDMVGGASGVQDQMTLDLGCGYGWFARWAADHGAKRVRAIDVSEKMIRRAKELDGEGRGGMIDYEIRDLETLTAAEDERDKYDLVYSSLTFHYVEDLGRLLREIRSCLLGGSSSATNFKAGKKSSSTRKGRFVFSVEHPICTAPISPAPDWSLVRDETNTERKVWPLNNYSEEGLRVTSWLGTAGVQKYHRTVETYVSLLLENGFVLTGLKDWVPSLEDVRAHPEWREERHRPYFLLVSAEIA
ncbi:S-adenosyl-L-methionine-dependent methyltransferase [Aspergillus steynii IBT 23096]|uniref:S-adenosyl-L-methionine-dependent methyltransferase n=1 Tax=Aspergillus steynii IBT 23096 TaxID=1392250 RepID=A0A2I2G089_9EURO|nr:S-adenosyl-L-methionine-dependent methyltransferase [Aspergillus steynii IBT 23096]PLB46297.1 S-adenosyl-L-methionine-dependent methyltransferase [Aspergillus steynii IBT 23096]